MATDSNNQGRGFAKMSESKRKYAAKAGGESQGKDNNPASFAQNREKATITGKAGGSK